MRMWRGSALFLSAVLTATLVQATVAIVSPQPARAAGGPSVPLPTIPSEAVTQQGRQVIATGDETTPRALSGNQQSSTSLPGTGDYSATSLSPSATWRVSGQTGDFTWSYPLSVPPAPGGLVPALALSYSSGSVDGLTSATNNQASWVGDGWSLWPGFIERSYRSCKDDLGLDDDEDGPGDLCWHTDNAVLSLNGSGGELIRDDATGVWKAKDDDGAKIERVTTAGNGDDDGESWKVTTVDGTQYFFGSTPTAKSTWTVPVFGDDSGEPCHDANFANAWCDQGYRWNVDKVVDRHGNMVRYYYDTELNHYGRNENSAAAQYVRGGWLDHVDYGLRADDASIPASGKVEFAVADRCVKNSECLLSKPENLPDVPLDLKCDGGSCGDKRSPSFWTTKKLTTVTTKSRVDGQYVPVDSWALRHELPDPGDGEKPALWLKGITHTGHTGTAITLPEVTFDGVRKENRVHGVDGYAALVRYRMNAIKSETGGVTSIRYADPECVFGTAMPANAHTNTMRCFPVRWAPKMAPERVDYFHKHVVEAVANHDGVEGTLATETSYEYLGGAAWHWDTSEFVEDEKKTWNQFRGFARVRIRSGSGADGDKTMSEQRFFRGMDGDRLPSGTRTASVTDSEGVVHTDHDWLHGFQLETATFEEEAASTAPDPRHVVKTIVTPFVHGPTATRAGFSAYIVRAGTADTYTAVGASGERVTRAVTGYETRWGLPTSLDDLGDVDDPADDLCTTTTYVPDETRWLIDFPSRVQTVSLRCGQTPVFPEDAVSDVLTYYDGQTSALPPTRGNPTQVMVAESRPATGPVYVTSSRSTFDARGRALTTTDALGNTSTSAYTPAVAGPVTATVTTTPPPEAGGTGFVTTTTFEPKRGQPVRIEDHNESITELTYDALGRSTEVWLPNLPRTDNPDGNYQFAYRIRDDGPTVVTTTKLGPNGNHVTTKELFDGLLRPRQTQAPAPGGGRLLTDTRYDSHGRAVRTTRPYYNNAAVDDNLWLPTDNVVPGATVVEYDGAGRPTAQVFQGFGDEKWRTSVEFGGDRTTVTPPDGGVVTTEVTDARGRTVELRQHGPGADAVTAYSYTPAGQLAQVTDPGGNTWTYGYDLRGNKVTEDDPDRGETAYAYDDAGRLVSSTDARGTTLVYSYDNLGRRKAVNRDSATGPRLADWTYDTVPFSKGMPATSTRYVGADAYTTRVLAYTALYQPAKVEVEIPAAEGTELAGKYASTLTYKENGALASETYAKAGALSAEGVSHSYNDLGLPARTWGGYNGSTVEYVSASDYTRYGELQRLELGQGTKRAWLSHYFTDDSRRLDRTVVDAEVPNPMQADFHYTYDDAGNITSVADTPVGVAADVQCYRYDHLRRLTEAWTPSIGCAADPTTGTLGGPAPYWHSYSYDATGNRLAETRHAMAGDTVRTYGYDGHQLDTVTTALPGGTTTLDEYEHDPAGNTTSKVLAGEGQTLEWDAEGHLAKVTEDGAETSYVYTADGRRLIRRDPQAVTLYLGNQEIRLDRVSRVTTGTRYYSHGGRNVAVRTEAGLSWLATDHNGTGEVAVNSDTLQVNRKRHLPFGETRGTAPTTWPGERGFVGGTEDPSTGLTHLGAREYDPSLGRFVSVDPIMDLGDPQQMNGYTYSNNSPITFLDPNGMKLIVSDNYWVDSGACRRGGCAENAPVVPSGQVDSPSGGGGRSNPVVTTTGAAPPPASPPKPKPEVRITPSTAVSNESPENYDEWKEVMSRRDDGGCAAEVAIFCFTYWLFLEDGVDCAVDHDTGACVGVGLNFVPFGKVLGLLGKIGKKADDVPSAPKAPSCRPSSFEPGTKVLLADGTSRPIEDIRVGDEVLATDPTTGTTSARKVVATITSEGDKELVRLAVGKGAVVATANHPFWDGDSWEPAGDLTTGASLRTSGGTGTPVLGAVAFSAVKRVHNLTISGVHTYYVLVGGAAVLVHNSPPGHCPVDADISHGRLGEAATRDRLETGGYSDIVDEVTFTTHGGVEFRPDFVARRPDGQWVAIESKTGKGARLTPGQLEGYPDLNTVGATVSTEKLTNYGLNPGDNVRMDIEVDIWECPICGS